MKLMDNKVFLLILFAFSMAVSAGTASAQIYKTVDENGTVIYTDKPPKVGAEPAKLPPISVIDAPAYKHPTAKKGTDAAQGDGSKPPSLRALRRSYRDFAIVAPKPEESIWHPEGPITAAWHTRDQLRAGMRVTLTLDGTKQPPSTASASPLTGLVRGQHTLGAVLKDAKERTIATAAPVTFYIRQANLNSNPSAAPRGGG